MSTNNINDLITYSHVYSSSVPTQVSLVAVNPDGSSIGGGSSLPTSPTGLNINDLEFQGFVMSLSVPGQVGVVLVNPDGSNL
jgi:hypothetical protein